MPLKSSKPTKPPLTPLPQPPPKSPSLNTHLATIEFKQKIITSLSKLSDKDTHQIAVQDLETLIQSLTPETITITLNSLYTATGDTTKNSPAIKKEAIRLLSYLCAKHTEFTTTHLTKIITHIVKRLKDSDFGVKDSCIESIGNLSCLYLKGAKGDDKLGFLVSLFVKPLFEAMNEQNKGVQSGAAMCMARMVEMASDPPVLIFQKMCNRICKFLNSPNFLANSALLTVVSSLSQVGAISPQVMEPLLQSIHDCLSSSDWSTRKAAADTLNALAFHSSNLIKEKPTSTITILEAARFDKIKPVRDSITEALQLWRFIAESCEDQELCEPSKLSGKNLRKLDDKKLMTPVKDGQTNGQSVPEKSIGTKKKAPPISDMELNPEFFQRLERRVSGEVEVVVNRGFVKSSNLQNEEVTEVNDESKSKSKESCQSNGEVNLERGNGGGSVSRRREFDNKGNCLAIQRQLLQLERQQTHLMNMLRDFKGGSRDGMVTLENRVWGLERVVEDMAQNLSTSMNSLRSSCYINALEESSGRSLSKYNIGFPNYPNTKLGRNDDRISYTNRGSSSWAHHTHGPNTRPKRAGPVRFGEGPSARSIWQASKDEATLEAIRGAGPEIMTSEEVSGNGNFGSVWRNAMDGVRVGDVDMAFGQVLSTGDDLLLVKLMDKTGPVIDRLSGDVASELLHAVAQFFLEPNLFDICLSWIQQLLDMIVENQKDVIGIPVEMKREILVNLNEASSTIDPPENWEGLMPDQLLLRLASVWDINLQQLLCNTNSNSV